MWKRNPVLEFGRRLAWLLVAGGFAAGASAQIQGVPEPPSGWPQEPEPEHPWLMPEDLRGAVDYVVVMAVPGPGEEDVGGTYGKSTYGLLGGMAAGSRFGRIQKQVGPVPVVIPIPILRLPGMIVGGVAGATQRELQEFRDALTEELLDADNQALTNDGLALDAFWSLRKLPTLQSKLIAAKTPMPESADAVLYVGLTGLEIDVQGKEAIITASAAVSLRPVERQSPEFEREIHYRDRDTLRNWTADDNRLWRDFVNYSRHYLGRELAAIAFDRVDLAHTLKPVESADVTRDRRDERRFVSKSTTPTLAWQLDVGDSAGYPWAGSIAEADISYDVEVYDAHRLVYAEERVPDPEHRLALELEPCGEYRFSVRPAYHVDGAVRYGDWLRLPPPVAASKDDDEEAGTEEASGYPGLDGRQASASPAYSQDFPALGIACGRR